MQTLSLSAYGDLCVQSFIRACWTLPTHCLRHSYTSRLVAGARTSLGPRPSVLIEVENSHTPSRRAHRWFFVEALPEEKQAIILIGRAGMQQLDVTTLEVIQSWDFEEV